MWLTGAPALTICIRRLTLRGPGSDVKCVAGGGRAAAQRALEPARLLLGDVGAGEREPAARREARRVDEVRRAGRRGQPHAAGVLVGVPVVERPVDELRV